MEFLLAIKACCLSGVNDDLDTMRELVHKLAALPRSALLPLSVRFDQRIFAPYGQALPRASRSSRACVDIRSGYAVPQYVIDAPGGGGKVPINPGYVLYHDKEKVVIRNYEGKVFEYPEAGVPVTNHHATELCSG